MNQVTILRNPVEPNGINKKPNKTQWDKVETQQNPLKPDDEDVDRDEDIDRDIDIDGDCDKYKDYYDEGDDDSHRKGIPKGEPIKPTKEEQLQQRRLFLLDQLDHLKKGDG